MDTSGKHMNYDVSILKVVSVSSRVFITLYNVPGPISVNSKMTIFCPVCESTILFGLEHPIFEIAGDVTESEISLPLVLGHGGMLKSYVSHSFAVSAVFKYGVGNEQASGKS